MKLQTGFSLRRPGNVISIILLGFINLCSYAQPSGGPYGPVNKTYEIPRTGGRIWYVAPAADPASSGEKLNLPATLENAIVKARTGDVIILRGGVYRTGDLVFNQGISLQPYMDEQPVLKGTQEAKEWKQINRGLWKISWKTLFPDKPDNWWSRDQFGKRTPLHIFNNDMVFVDGQPLHSAGWEGEVDEHSFYVDYASQNIYIGTDPKDHLVEITAHNFGLHRVMGDANGVSSDKKGLILKGITLTQYAFYALTIDGSEPEGPADPSTFGKDVPGSVIENCTFSYCGRVGAYLHGDNLVMRNCNVHHTTTEGIYLLSSSDCLLEHNMFSQNNVEDIAGYYPAAVKIFNQTHRVTCSDNLIFDLPLSNGIWYDVGNVDGRFINNWVEGVGSSEGPGSNNQMWPSSNGFFFEISKGAICAGNVFVNCDHGIMILNSSGVQVYQNTFYNSTACIGRDKRSAQGDHFGWHPSTGPDVDKRFGHVFVNNLLAGDDKFKRPLMLVWQHPDLCKTLDKSPLVRFDNDVFVRNPAAGFTTILFWSPSQNFPNCQQPIENLDGLKTVFPGANLQSRVYTMAQLPLFKSVELHRFELNGGFPGLDAGTVLPVEISKLLQVPAKGKPHVGAYPSR